MTSIARGAWPLWALPIVGMLALAGVLVATFGTSRPRTSEPVVVTVRFGGDETNLCTVRPEHVRSGIVHIRLISVPRTATARAMIETQRGDLVFLGSIPAGAVTAEPQGQTMARLPAGQVRVVCVTDGSRHSESLSVRH